MKIYWLFLFFLFFITACVDKEASKDGSIENTIDTSIRTNAYLIKDSFETGKIIREIICKNDPSQSFALYLPLKNNKEALPVIYFFDPHADGSLPLKKYKDLADNYNFILVGSNNSKNGNDWTITENLWNNLFADTRNRLIFNPDRIYTCGFSGGAKVASFVALHHSEIKGVIANGAGLPDEVAAGNFNFSFTGIAGKGDMNMTGLVAIDNSFNNTQTKHRIILFDGKHEWAPPATMNIAFASLEFDAMNNNRIAKNDSLLSAYVKDSKKSLDDFLKANNLILAEKEAELSINILAGLRYDFAWFKTKKDSIANTASYKVQLQSQQELFNVEQARKAEYQQQFQQQNEKYWNTTINDLQIKSKKNTPEGEMYQRLLAYLSLAFFSFSNQAINNNQDESAVYFVTLYKKADATNSEAWYFSALLNARKNNAKATEDDLIRAIGYGFTDAERLTKQPEFQKLSAEINLPKILAMMRKE